MIAPRFAVVFALAGASAVSVRPALAQTAAAESCVKCHGGLEEMHPWQAITCSGCHGGDPAAAKKEQAHVRPRATPPNDERLLPRDYDPAWVQFVNPSDLRIVAKTCNVCHTAVCGDLMKSLHCTTAGHLSDGLYENGLTKSRRTRFSIFAVRDDDGDVPKNAFAALDPLPSSDDPSRRSELVGHVADLERKSCMQCHLWGNGTAVRGRLGQDGNYRSSGCAACHVTYSDDGISKSRDGSIDHFEPGHPLQHTFTAAPPTQTCVRCHFGDASIGLAFRGLAQLAPGMPAGPEVKGTTSSLLNGAFYVDDPKLVPPDVHHERGMHCIDCHTARDVMGDGNAYGFMEHAVEIECTDCHGTFDAPTRLETSRGHKLDHLHVEKGLVYLVSKVDGKRHFVPQAAHVVDPARPEFNPRAARAMTREHARLECYSCHAGWNVDFFGFHFDRNEAFTQLDLVSGERTKGRCTTQEKVFTTYRQLQLGFNDEGKIAPFMVGFSTMGSVRDEKGGLIADQQLPVTAAGLSGMTMVHHQLHTTRATSRRCAECHRSPATVGLGSGSFNLSREVAAAVDERGLHLIAIDREHLDFSAPLASLPLPDAVGIAAVCDDLQGRFQTLFVALGHAGVAIVDARRPEFPEKVGFLDCVDPRELEVRAGILYVADGVGGIALFDVADPKKARLLARVATLEARGLTLSFPQLYVADGRAGVKVFDVSDPTAPDFIAHLDLNLDAASPDDACAVKLLFQYSRPDDGLGNRTVARKIAAIAGGLQGAFLFDVTDPARAERLFPPAAMRIKASSTDKPAGDVPRFLDVQVLSRIDLGSPGGEIASEENDYAFFAIQPVEETMTPGSIALVRITDPTAPKFAGAAPVPDGAFRLTTAAWYNPPFLQRFALVAGRNAVSAVNTSASDKPTLLGPLFGEGLRVRDLVVEEFPFDRMVDESGRALKDLSHEGGRYFDRAELLRILGVKLAPSDLWPWADPVDDDK